MSVLGSSGMDAVRCGAARFDAIRCGAVQRQLLGEHTQGKQRITPLPSRVRHTRSLYLLTIGTQAATEATTPAGVYHHHPNPQVDRKLEEGAHPPCSTLPTSPQYRFMPQAPNKDEPFIIVITGAKHTHVRDEQQFYRCA